MELEKLLRESNYPQEKTDRLVNGFKNGFDLGYRNEEKVQMKSKNLKFTIGDETELWNKVMKEVKEKRYAGPYEQIPFEDDFIQSPIGLVPKDNGTKTRLIFHLSHPRGKGTSVNACTPPEITKVKYSDFDEAVLLCIKAGKNCKIGKSDLSAAFRRLCLAKRFWRYLIMKAKNPTNQKTYYFVDKCLPFGASISCALFQEFSDALSHIVFSKTGSENINYLDDFFFADVFKKWCDQQIHTFLQVCKQIRFPVSEDKTEWASTRLIFLGLLIDTVRQLVMIPVDKVNKAKDFITMVLNKKNKKITLKQLQQLCGYLNFLCKAIVPGRAFTRRLYAHGKGLKKQNHHLKITAEIRMDLELWMNFINGQHVYARPFFQFNNKTTSDEISFYTDASSTLGCGGICDTAWFMMEWDEQFTVVPSINYLELYALTVGIINFLDRFKNRKITIFCDNQSVVHMINSTTSSCKNSMVLIRIIVLKCLYLNIKLTAKYVPSKENVFADKLSRLDYKGFRKEARRRGMKFDNRPTPIPEELLPVHTLMFMQ